jgi:hypothetical protein
MHSISICRSAGLLTKWKVSEVIDREIENEYALKQLEQKQLEISKLEMI